MVRGYYKKRVKKRSDKEKLAEIYGCKCYYCDQDIDFTSLTIDHIYPKILGGKSDIRNYVLSCLKCNSLKSQSVVSIEDFRKEMMGASYYPFGLKKVEKEKEISIPKKKEPKFKPEYAHNIVYPENILVCKYEMVWWYKIKRKLSTFI